MILNTFCWEFSTHRHWPRRERRVRLTGQKQKAYPKRIAEKRRKCVRADGRPSWPGPDRPIDNCKHNVAPCWLGVEYRFPVSSASEGRRNTWDGSPVSLEDRVCRAHLCWRVAGGEAPQSIGRLSYNCRALSSSETLNGFSVKRSKRSALQHVSGIFSRSRRGSV